jgi:hypothetical protein
MKTVFKLEKFLDAAIKGDSRSALITGKNGEYTAFGRYYIKPHNRDYLIYDRITKETITLSSLKHAMTWCTLVDCKKYSAASRLETLDLKLIRIDLDITIHKNLVRTTANDNKLVYIIKLQEDSYKKKTLSNEIEALINKSKALQESRFQKPKRNKFSYW